MLTARLHQAPRLKLRIAVFMLIRLRGVYRESFTLPIGVIWGQAVAQLVEVLVYKP